MDNSIELLEKQLAEKIANLDKERAAQLAAFSKEEEERKVIETAEREERVKAIKASEEKRLAREKASAEAEAKREQERREEKIKAEQLANEAQEIVRKQQAKLDYLTKAISEAERLEEQHSKAVEEAKTKLTAPSDIVADEENVNAHILTGEAAVGTDGIEVGPIMSAHLRSILRRANSDIN